MRLLAAAALLLLLGTLGAQQAPIDLVAVVAPAERWQVEEIGDDVWLDAVA